jgi:hypothetical protein
MEAFPPIALIYTLAICKSGDIFTDVTVIKPALISEAILRRGSDNASIMTDATFSVLIDISA